MRKGSKFKGTKKELDNAIKKNLPLFISNLGWLDKMKENVSQEEFLNICESIAEAVDRGYIKNKIIVHDMMNGSITFSSISTSDKEPSYELSIRGKEFLEL